VEFGLLTLLPFSEVGGIDLYGREEKNLWLYRKLDSWVAVSTPCPGPGCPETACFVGKLSSVLSETVVKPCRVVVLMGTVVLRTTACRQCLWTSGNTDRQFQVLPRTAVVAKSLVLAATVWTVSNLVQDKVSGTLYLHQQVGPGALLSE